MPMYGFDLTEENLIKFSLPKVYRFKFLFKNKGEELNKQYAFVLILKICML